MRRGVSFGAVMVLALAVRLVGLSRENLWIDEVNSVAMARGSPLGIVSRMRERQEMHPPLYYFLLSCSIAVTGESDASMRLPSVIAGTLAVPLAGLLASRVAPGAELPAALLAALAPGLVRSSQDARMYALLSLLGGAVLLLWLDGAPTRGSRIALSILTAAMLLTHSMGLLFGAGLGLLALLWPGFSRQERWSRAGPLFAGFLLHSPWLLEGFRQYGTYREFLRWNIVLSLPAELLRILPHAALGDVPRFLPARRIFQLLVVVASILGVLAILARRKGALLIAAMLVPPVAVAAVSLASPSFLHRRYLGFLGLPLMAVLGAAGTLKSRRWLARSTIGSLALCFSIVDVAALFESRSVDMRGVIEHVREIRGPGETVFHYAPFALPEEGFFLMRHYEPTWEQCLIRSAGRAHSPAQAGHVGQACVVEDLARAASGRNRLLIVLTGVGMIDRPSDRLAPFPITPAESLAELERQLPPGWRVLRVRTFHLARVVEAAM